MSLRPLSFPVGHFVVWADDCRTSLGSWAKAEGLGRAGQVVELTRAAGAESELVQKWLVDLDFHPRQSDVTVTLVDGLGDPVTSRQLTHVVPVHWSIEDLDRGSVAVALETLELRYEESKPGNPC